MINYFSQTMNFLLNQIEVFLNSEASHLCLVWISTVLYSRAAPFELSLRAVCYYRTGWKFYTARPGTVCQKHFQVLSGWAIHYVFVESTVKLVSSDWFDISFWQPTYFHFFHGMSWLIIWKFAFIFGIFLLWFSNWSSVISLRLSVIGFLRTLGQVLGMYLEVDQNNLYTLVLTILNHHTIHCYVLLFPHKTFNVYVLGESRISPDNFSLEPFTRSRYI